LPLNENAPLSAIGLPGLTRQKEGTEGDYPYTESVNKTALSYSISLHQNFENYF
jgi:hypothetical protein